MKDNLLALLQHARQEIQTSVDGLSGAQRSDPGSPTRWSAKDNLAHVAEWARRFLASLDGAPLPEVGESGAELDAENARIYAQYHSQSWAETLAFVDQVYTKMARRIEAMPEETLLATDAFPSQGGRVLWRLIAGNFYSHLVLHLGYDYLARGERDSVLRLNEQAARSLLDLDASPAWQGVSLYNLGCIYAMIGEKERAISFVSQALRLEPQLIDWSKQDTDLASLRDDPAFQALYAPA